MSSAMSSTTNRAIRKIAPGHAAVVESAVPQLRPGYMLVKTAAVALNPADWTDIDHEGAFLGCLVGIDYSGVVVQVHEENEPRAFRPGDRVAGAAHGCNSAQPEDGAFAEYIVVKTSLQMHIPDGMSFEEAATLGCGVMTAGKALYQELPFALPSSDGSGKDVNAQACWLLVYGGSSATGNLAIQFAKLVSTPGIKVVSTCSPQNFDLVRASGADIVLDYHNPNICELIHTATSNSLLYIFDTIATTATATICIGSLTSVAGSGSAIYACTLDPDIHEAAATAAVPVEKKFFHGYIMFGEAFTSEGEDFPVRKADYNFAVTFMKLVEGMLAQSRLKPHPASTNLGGVGLEGVINGLDLLRRGKVSGRKLVYTINSEDPSRPNAVNSP